MLASCARSAEQPSAAAPPSARYPLKNDDGTIGTIISGAVCAQTLLLADVEGRIYRLNLQSAHTLRPLSVPALQPMAVAADCARRLIWVISPSRPRGLRAVAIDYESGQQMSDVPLDATCFVRSAIIAEGELIAAGECLTDPRQTDPPPAESYYANRRNGFRMSTTTGEMHAGLEPYQLSCIGAGACVGGAIAVLPDVLYAALPTASSIGVYSRSGELRRTLPVVSPAFKRDGTTLRVGTAAEARVRWSARNSLLYRVFALPAGFVVVHELALVPPNWTLSSAVRPQFKAWASTFSKEGQPIHLDVELPELPVAFDGEHLFVVDYGLNGRQGAHEQVSVVRIKIN